MTDPTVFGCMDKTRREMAFADTYDRVHPTALLKDQNDIKLPPFIAGVKSGLSLEAADHIPLFAISLGDIITTQGDLRFQSVAEIRKFYKLPSNAKLALIGTSKDSKLQALWRMSDLLNIWERIAKMGFEWVTGLSFSVWDEQPRFDQIVNQDRNLLTYDYLNSHGVPSIPIVYPHDESDYRAFGAWMEERRSIRIVAVYAAFYRRNIEFIQFLANMRSIQKNISRPVEFLVISAATQPKIDAVLSEFKASFVNWKPFQKARSGQICDSELKYTEHKQLSRDKLAAINFEKNFHYCDALTRATQNVKVFGLKEKWNYELRRKLELSSVQ